MFFIFGVLRPAFQSESVDGLMPVALHTSDTFNPLSLINLSNFSYIARLHKNMEIRKKPLDGFGMPYYNKPMNYGFPKIHKLKSSIYYGILNNSNLAITLYRNSVIFANDITERRNRK